MFFSKKKKLQRDRDAGLVFRWRGGYGSNRGGSTIAFLLTSLFFAGGVIMLNVYAKPNTVPSRYRASMIQLGEMNDDLRWWVEKNSPNLPLWSGHNDEVSESKVSEMLAEKMYESQGATYRYEDVEMKQIELDNEEIYSIRTRSLPLLSRFRDAEVQDNGQFTPLEWELSVTAGDGLKERLPGDLDYGSFIPESWRGNSVRFVVAVDAGGKVLSVDPTEWNEDKVVRGFEDWIQTFAFKPVVGGGSDDVVTGLLVLSLLPVVEGEMKEVGP